VPPNQTEFFAGSLGFDQWTTNLDLIRAVEIGLAGPLNVALGAELRRDGYQIEAGELNSYIDGGWPNQFGGRAAPGAQVFPGFRPSDEVDTSRSSYALYADLEGDVLKRLRLGVAVRFEDYQDFGSTSDYKVTARFQPVEQLVLRAGLATGFRAPSLGQAHFSAVSTNFLAVGGVLQPFEVGTFPVGSAVARALGAKDLEPEESKHLSAGIVWAPTSRFEIGLDYYRVDIEDRIVFSGNFTGPQVAALLAPFNVTGARFFTNAVDTETEGWDLNTAYSLAGGGTGDWRFSLGYNQTENRVVGTIQTPPQPGQMSPPAELDILLVHEQLLGEAAELGEGLSPDRQRRSAGGGHVLEPLDALRGLAEPTGPRQAADVDDGSAGVEQVGPIEQPQTGHRDSDHRVVQRPRELCKRAVRHDRVRVEEHEHIADRLGGAAVAAAGEAEVLAGLDQAHPTLALRGSNRRIAPTVVDDDHLRLDWKRAQAAGERLARLVSDDDDRKRQ